MHTQDFAILKALVPVAWADGVFAKSEQEMLRALLEAYGASNAERDELLGYASTKKSLEDIPLAELSANDRRVVLHHAVVLAFADGVEAPSETAMLNDLAARLRIPADEATALIHQSAARAQKHLGLLSA
jgi:tellurite resistance protein